MAHYMPFSKSQCKLSRETNWKQHPDVVKTWHCQHPQCKDRLLPMWNRSWYEATYHIQEHVDHPSKDNQCRTCSKNAGSYKESIEHMYNHHTKEKYLCKGCHHDYTTIHEAEQHAINAKREYVCQLCQSHSRNEHMPRVHQKWYRGCFLGRYKYRQADVLDRSGISSDSDDLSPY